MPKISKPVQNTQGKTSTKPNATGEVLVINDLMDKGYLCLHICFAEKNPITSKSGSKLKQVACTRAIWAEEEANQLIWKYKAEVGYIMTENPPAPIMSPKEGEELRPSRFPLGRASQMGVFTKDTEISSKGRLRIPDCIVLKISDEELIRIRIHGQGNFDKLIPIQKNIDTVVEIKFGNDVLSQSQIKAYRKIAGSDNKLKQLRDTDCHCNLDFDPPKNKYQLYEKTGNYTYKSNPFEYRVLGHRFDNTWEVSTLSNKNINNIQTSKITIDNEVVATVILGTFVIIGSIALAPKVIVIGGGIGLLTAAQ